MVLRTANSVENKQNNPALRSSLHPNSKEIGNKYMTSAGVKCYREKIKQVNRGLEAGGAIL